MKNTIIRKIKYYKKLGYNNRQICKLTGSSYVNVLKYTYNVEPKDSYTPKDTSAMIDADKRLKLRQICSS